MKCIKFYPPSGSILKRRLISLSPSGFKGFLRSSCCVDFTSQLQARFQDFNPPLLAEHAPSPFLAFFFRLKDMPLSVLYSIFFRLSSCLSATPSSICTMFSGRCSLANQLQPVFLFRCLPPPQTSRISFLAVNYHALSRPLSLYGEFHQGCSRTRFPSPRDILHDVSPTQPSSKEGVSGTEGLQVSLPPSTLLLLPTLLLFLFSQHL